MLERKESFMNRVAAHSEISTELDKVARQKESIKWVPVTYFKQLVLLEVRDYKAGMEVLKWMSKK